MPTSRGLLSAIATSLRGLVFGHDFFISYRSADGSNYARSLHAALKLKGFDCFLDHEHYAAGHNLPHMQTRALSVSTKLLVVVSPRAHVSPPTGVDWLLAEVKEFKYLVGSRARTSVVSLGTPDTLSSKHHPDSALLREIPTPSRNHLCVFDDAIARDESVSPQTVERIEVDFKQRRRRHVRIWALLIAGLGFAIAVSLGMQAHFANTVAQRQTRIAESFAYLDRGRDALDAQRPGSARRWFQEAADALAALGLDPISALHHRFAADLTDIAVKPIAKVEREVGEIYVSADGDWLLFVQDYQAPSGSPDLSQILDLPAFSVFHVPTRQWKLQQKVGTPIGTEMYGKEGYDRSSVIAFEPPDHVVLRDRSNASESFVRVSLVTGARQALSGYSVGRARQTSPRAPGASARVESLLAPERLFRVDPRDGIDRDYGPRTPEESSAEAPSGRTRLIGTYEGRYLLVDLGTGQVRAQGNANPPIYAVAYRPDGAKAWFCDDSNLFEIDVESWPGVSQFHLVNDKKVAGAEADRLLALAITEDGLTVAAVTPGRLVVRTSDGKQRSWILPRKIEALAAIEIDATRSRVDMVVADDGTLISLPYASTAPTLEVSTRPGSAGPAVARIDVERESIWLTDRGGSQSDLKSRPGSVLVHRLALPGSRASSVPTGVVVELDRPMEEDETIHALARVGSELIVVVGDTEFFSDQRDLLDERVLRIPMGASVGTTTSQKIFASQRGRGGPDTTSSVTRVTAVLPGSRSDSLLLQTEFAGTYQVDSRDAPRRIGSALASLRTGEGAFAYTLVLQETRGDAWMLIERPGDESPFKYMLPWRFAEPPVVGAIAKNGRQIVLGSRQGDVLLIDVTKRHPQ